jgi:hypothetical protein
MRWKHCLRIVERGKLWRNGVMAAMIRSVGVEVGVR